MAQRNWLLPHRDSEKGLRGSSVEAERGREAATYLYDSDPVSLLSRRARYLAARQASQKRSDEDLLRVLQRRSHPALARHALAEEARARGLTLPDHAPETLPGRLSNDGERDAAVAALGALGIGLATKVLTNGTLSAPSGEGPLEGMTPLLERLHREHGTRLQVADVPDHYDPVENVVSVRPTSHRSVLAHELGHATPPKGLSRLMMKGYGPARLASALLAPALVSGALYYGSDDSLQTEEDALRDISRAQALMGGTAALATPFLWEEARATKNATKYLNELFGRREAMKGLARLMPAYATYLAAGAAAPGLGLAMLASKKRKLKKSIEDRKGIDAARQARAAKKAA